MKKATAVHVNRGGLTSLPDFKGQFPYPALDPHRLVPLPPTTHVKSGSTWIRVLGCQRQLHVHHHGLLWCQDPLRKNTNFERAAEPDRSCTSSDPGAKRKTASQRRGRRIRQIVAETHSPVKSATTSTRGPRQGSARTAALVQARQQCTAKSDTL